MGHVLIEELLRNQKRLEFYKSLQKKPQMADSVIIQKWISLYVTRIEQLRQECELRGLRVQLDEEKNPHASVITA